jgi:cbb3-type cytochrome oxidase cytochrome c subunit
MYSIVALVLGFSLGVLVMIGLSIFLDEAEGSEADASELDELAVAEAEVYERDGNSRCYAQTQAQTQTKPVI